MLQKIKTETEPCSDSRKLAKSRETSYEITVHARIFQLVYYVGMTLTSQLYNSSMKQPCVLTVREFYEQN